jgi:hypothetical protein
MQEDKNDDFENKKGVIDITPFLMAGETGIEPAAYGFGDRRSTN